MTSGDKIPARDAPERLAGDTRGTTAIEYALIASAVAAAIAAIVYTLGGETVSGLYARVAGLF